MPLHFNKISDLTKSYVEQGELAGTVTLISHHNQIVYFNAMGKMNLETGQPMRNDAIFRLYSMTKPITSVAAMLLYERGAFSLNTPVSEFLPEFEDMQVFVSGSATDFQTTNPETEMTMGNLLSHTSGLTIDFKRETVVDEIYRNARLSSYNIVYPLDVFTKLVSKIPLLFSPGTNWNYSVSTDILGRIIEIISNQTLAEFMKNKIFDPLKMVDTDFYVPSDKQDRFCANYMRNEVGLPKKLLLCDSPTTGRHSKPPIAYSGGAGLVSTAGDFLNFTSMLLNEGKFNKIQFLKPDTVTLMTKNYIPENSHNFSQNVKYASPGQGYGLGFGITLDPKLEQTAGNAGTFGWSGAAHTIFFVDPKEELIALFFTQQLPYSYNLELLNEFKIAVYESIYDVG